MITPAFGGLSGHITSIASGSSQTPANKRNATADGIILTNNSNNAADGVITRVRVDGNINQRSH